MRPYTGTLKFERAYLYRTRLVMSRRVALTRVDALENQTNLISTQRNATLHDATRSV